MATRKEIAPVLVVWYDAEAIVGWTGEDELAEYLKQFKPVYSVGYPFRTPDENYDLYVLYSDLDETNGNLNRIQIIPNGMVVSVVQLAVQPKPARKKAK